MSKNELSNSNAFTALKGFNLADAMSEEMVGMDVSFDRIKIPAGHVSKYAIRVREMVARRVALLEEAAGGYQ